MASPAPYIILASPFPVSSSYPFNHLRLTFLAISEYHARIDTMGLGAILEPLVVVVLLFGGTWINRSRGAGRRRWRKDIYPSRSSSPDSFESSRSMILPDEDDPLCAPRSWSPSLLPLPEERWRKRQLRFLSFGVDVTTPNTAAFQDRLLSRLLQKLPFLVECWYWALVYWV